MGMFTPNPLGIRNIVPKGIRDYFSIETKKDNVVFGQQQLDKKLLDLYREIKTNSTSSSSKDLVVDNVLIYSDAYLYALRTIFRLARSRIRIFTHQLDQRMVDGTPLFTDPDIIDATVDFLSGSNAKLEILFRDRPDENLLERSTLITELRGIENLVVYYSENRVVKDCRCTFIGVDDQIYNLRYRNYAIINFNNPSYSQELSAVFDRVRNLSTTSVLSF